MSVVGLRSPMWALLLVLATGTGVQAAATTPKGSTTVEPRTDWRAQSEHRQARLIRKMVRRADPAAVDYLLKAVASGLPPRSLAAFLDEVRIHPDPAFVSTLRRLTQYRKDTIRARALVALAAVDVDHGSEAALVALDDPKLEIRVLGLELARRFTAPNVEDAVLLLVDRDAEIAAADAGMSQ